MSIVTEKHWKASKYVEYCRPSSFERALMGMVVVADATNMGIITHHWGDQITDMAVKYDKLIMRELSRHALETCQDVRGHLKMVLASQEETASGYGQRTYECANPDCCGYVQVMPSPPPNGIDIGGTAVAMNCPIGDEYHWNVNKRTRNG